MNSRLPPLNALRAFEATARHLSVKSAASELNVTPGAVSQMIKVLERHLGLKLFRRAGRGVFLTDAGHAYWLAIRNALRQIADASVGLSAAVETGELVVSVPPFFASAWLVPRLKNFQETHPSIDLKIVASKELADFARERIDIAIRHGLGKYPGLVTERLFAVELIPVASPSLLAEWGAPDVAALVAWPLLHDAERKDWALWFQAQGESGTDVLRGPSFNDSSLLLEAALAGQGAALLPAMMVARYLDERRVVRLAEAPWPRDFAYYVVYPERAPLSPKRAEFRDWLRAQAAGTEQAGG